VLNPWYVRVGSYPLTPQSSSLLFSSLLFSSLLFASLLSFPALSSRPERWRFSANAQWRDHGVISACVPLLFRGSELQLRHWSSSQDWASAPEDSDLRIFIFKFRLSFSVIPTGAPALFAGAQRRDPGVISASQDSPGRSMACLPHSTLNSATRHFVLFPAESDACTSN
jgi:hypothetical protein